MCVCVCERESFCVCEYMSVSMYAWFGYVVMCMCGCVCMHACMRACIHACVLVCLMLCVPLVGWPRVVHGPTCESQATCSDGRR